MNVSYSIVFPVSIGTANGVHKRRTRRPSRRSTPAEDYGEDSTSALSPHSAPQGIRPAGGYPSQPDHKEKHTLFHEMLQVDELVAGKMSLTESFMMVPAASVSALVFAHPKSHYFAVGPVAKVGGGE